MELFKTVSYFTDFLNTDPEGNLTSFVHVVLLSPRAVVILGGDVLDTLRDDALTGPRCGPVSVLFFLPLPYYYNQFTSFHLKLAEYCEARFDSVHAESRFVF